MNRTNGSAKHYDMTCSVLRNLLQHVTSHHFPSVLGSVFNELQMALALQFGVVRRQKDDTGLQVLIVALVALSLQIMTSINMILGRSAIKDCNLWRETDFSQR